jgi:formylglycine-generating enzyme required for sulfatase activity
MTRLLAVLLPLALSLLLTPACTRNQPGKEIKAKDGTVMVLVPDGEFPYGENGQAVELPAFFIDKFEVAAQTYATFLATSGRKAPEYWDEVKLDLYGNRPVVWVTWEDADAYCRWAGKRLPTEQEWEKAARGGDERKFPWGNDEPTPSLASYDWDGRRAWQGYQTLAPVQNYEAGRSPYGAHNMAGNAAEWTGSKYDSTNKVIRGGAWNSAPQDMQASNRAYRPPTNWNSYLGFRCAKDA